MVRFRKKPVIIDAVQFTTNEQSIVDIMALMKDGTKTVQVENGAKELFIHTLEGKMKAELNDWIIKGVHGELYPCKPDIFHKTYEPVDPRLN